MRRLDFAHCFGRTANRREFVAGALSEEEYIAGLRAEGLEDVVVRERLVYDVSQLKGLIRSDLADADQQVANWVASMDDETLSGIVNSVAGKAWSAMFYAPKQE